MTTDCKSVSDCSLLVWWTVSCFWRGSLLLKSVQHSWLPLTAEAVGRSQQSLISVTYWIPKSVIDGFYNKVDRLEVNPSIVIMHCCWMFWCTSSSFKLIIVMGTFCAPRCRRWYINWRSSSRLQLYQSIHGIESYLKAFAPHMLKHFVHCDKMFVQTLQSEIVHGESDMVYSCCGSLWKCLI